MRRRGNSNIIICVQPSLLHRRRPMLWNIIIWNKRRIFCAPQEFSTKTFFRRWGEEERRVKGWDDEREPSWDVALLHYIKLCKPNTIKLFSSLFHFISHFLFSGPTQRRLAAFSALGERFPRPMMEKKFTSFAFWAPAFVRATQRDCWFSVCLLSAQMGECNAFLRRVQIREILAVQSTRMEKQTVRNGRCWETSESSGKSCCVVLLLPLQYQKVSAPPPSPATIIL